MAAITRKENSGIIPKEFPGEFGHTLNLPGSPWQPEGGTANRFHVRVCNG
jgi:hypothetical protein